MDVKAWLQSGGMKLGTIVTIDHPAIVEIARLAGFDWLWIDGEHGRFNEVSAATACAVTAGGPPTFVRLPDLSATAIKRFLDTGCDGIILPQVSSAAEVDEIARAALYPPRGERSVGIARAQGYGTRFAECLRTAGLRDRRADRKRGRRQEREGDCEAHGRGCGGDRTV